MTPIRATETGCRIRVRVQPRASRTESAGIHGDALRIRVAAPPVDGAANLALVRFLADRLRVPQRAVTVVRGAAAREKDVEVTGVGPEAAARALGI